MLTTRKDAFGGSAFIAAPCILSEAEVSLGSADRYAYPDLRRCVKSPLTGRLKVL
jgi:hypothetical protein